MSLREKQATFARLLAILITWIFDHDGWEVTLGEGQVDARRGHMPGSLHYLRLAQDLNLFVDNLYIPDGNHPAWKAIGEHWETLDKDARWGGRFSDANHVSITEGGKA